MALQRAWFERNGSAGYVLKPKCLRELTTGGTCHELTQPNQYFSQLPSKLGKTSLETTANQRPCMILKVDVKFAYACHVPTGVHRKRAAYYAINQETEVMKSLAKDREEGKQGLERAESDWSLLLMKSQHPDRLKQDSASFDEKAFRKADAVNMGALRVQMEIRGTAPHPLPPRLCLTLGWTQVWSPTRRRFPPASLSTSEGTGHGMSSFSFLS
jgi:hypothetical protein